MLSWSLSLCTDLLRWRASRALLTPLLLLVLRLRGRFARAELAEVSIANVSHVQAYSRLPDCLRAVACCCWCPLDRWGSWAKRKGVVKAAVQGEVSSACSSDLQP